MIPHNAKVKLTLNLVHLRLQNCQRTIVSIDSLSTLIQPIVSLEEVSSFSMAAFYRTIAWRAWALAARWRDRPQTTRYPVAG
eukprot:5564784-Pyramimonas_sp.AAC.1